MKADLPGVKQNDIKVTLEDDCLVIEATRSHEAESKDGDYHRMERESGSYYRAVPLPVGVTAGAVHAAYKDGVLEVAVDLPQETKQKTVPIKVE